MASSTLQDVAILQPTLHQNAIPPHNESKRLRGLPRELRLFILITVALGLLCATSELFCAFVLHLNGLYTWPTLPFFDCTDFRCFMPRFQYFHQCNFFSDDPSHGLPFGYPAPGAVLYQCFYLLRPHPLVCFFVITLAGIAALLWLLARQMRVEHLRPCAVALFLTASVVFSYPLWFEYLLGNMEVCIFLLVAGGVIAFLVDRPFIAAVCFAFAGSIKIFPFVYLGLLLARRQYRALALGILLPIPITLASLWLVCPSIALAQQGILNGLSKFRTAYLLTYRPIENSFDHSLFGLIKHWVVFDSTQQFDAGMRLYIALGALAGTVLYVTRIRRLPVINQVLCLATASILFPPLSHDYNLLQLYVPWGLLVVLALRAARREQKINGLASAFVAFAILFAPQTEFIVDGLSYGGSIKAIVLATLLVLGLRYRYEAIPSAGVSLVAPLASSSFQ